MIKVVTALDFLIALVLAGIAIPGAVRGFFELLIALFIGYLVLCAFLWGLHVFIFRPGQRDAIKRSVDGKGEGRWQPDFPPCDIRSLHRHILYYFLASPGISLVAFWADVADGKSQMHPLIRLAGFGTSLLSTAVAVGGLLFLWGWTVQRLGATEDVSSSLSKPIEMVVCYSLLVAGLVWVGVATYLPIWATALLSG